MEFTWGTRRVGEIKHQLADSDGVCQMPLREWAGLSFPVPWLEFRCDVGNGERVLDVHADCNALPEYVSRGDGLEQWSLVPTLPAHHRAGPLLLITAMTSESLGLPTGN